MDNDKEDLEAEGAEEDRDNEPIGDEPDDEDSGEDDEGGSEPKPKKQKQGKLRDPIQPTRIPKVVMGPMRAFIKAVDRFNSRVVGGKYKVSAYCAVAIDFAEKKGRSTGGMILHQGKILHAASQHVDLGLRSSEGDAKLHRLFSNRLIYHHMARDHLILDHLEEQLKPATHADQHGMEGVEEGGHEEMTPMEVEEEGEEGFMPAIQPVRNIRGATWEENKRLAKEMMLTLYNMDWGDDDKSFGES